MQMAGAVANAVGSFQAQQQNIENEKAEVRSLQEAVVYEEAKRQRETTLALGKARAITAATGLDPSTGSPLLLELDNAKQAAIEMLNLHRSGVLAVQEKERGIEQAKKNTAWNVLSMYGQLGSAGSSALQTWYDWKNSKTAVRTPKTGGA